MKLPLPVGARFAVSRRRAKIALTFLLLMAVAWPTLAADRVTLTILHTNDLHGMMLPFDYDDWEGFFKAQQPSIGGMARRASLVKRIRGETPNLAVVDAGDVFSRGPWHEKWYGVPEIEAMNLMGYDLIVVGNNEVKPIWDNPKSKEMMLALMRRSRFPWLSANLTLGDGPPPGCDDLAPVEGIHPFIVRTYGDLRVGFLGLTTAACSEYTFLEGWTFADPIAAAKRWVPIARTECDIIIVVTHIGDDWDRKLGAEVPGIDAIVGGHSHTFTPQPIGVRGPEGRTVPVVQAGEKGVVLGRFDLTFERTDSPSGAVWKLAGANETLMPIMPDIPEDAAVTALLERYLAASAPVGAAASAPR